MFEDKVDLRGGRRRASRRVFPVAHESIFDAPRSMICGLGREAATPPFSLPRIRQTLALGRAHDRVDLDVDLDVDLVSNHDPPFAGASPRQGVEVHVVNVMLIPGL